MNYHLSRQDGFTLVEVLVASAIAVASMGLLLSLFAGSLDRMSRIEMQSQRLIVEKEIVTRLSLVNPAVERSGEGRIGSWTYHWQSQPLTDFRKTTDYFSSTAAPRSVALYAISIELDNPRARSASLEIKRLGWQS